MKELPLISESNPKNPPRQILAIKVPAYDSFTKLEFIKAATHNLKLDPIRVMNCDLLVISDNSNIAVAVLEIIGTYRALSRSRIGILYKEPKEDHPYFDKKINFRKFQKIRFTDIPQDFTRSRAINH